MVHNVSKKNVEVNKAQSFSFEKTRAMKVRVPLIIKTHPVEL